MPRYSLLEGWLAGQVRLVIDDVAVLYHRYVYISGSIGGHLPIKAELVHLPAIHHRLPHAATVHLILSLVFTGFIRRRFTLIIGVAAHLRDLQLRVRQQRTSTFHWTVHVAAIKVAISSLHDADAAMHALPHLHRLMLAAEVVRRHVSADAAVNVLLLILQFFRVGVHVEQIFYCFENLFPNGW